MKENIACRINERFRNRSRNGGFISRPEKTFATDSRATQCSRNGGFVAWPVSNGYSS